MTQDQALTILKTGTNVFLTGEPGAGKTHTIREYVRYLREHAVEPAITASTGIAATHIHGVTIHSWSGIGIRSTLGPYDLDALGNKEYLVKRLKNATVLIIDEVSMLSAGMLSMIEEVCRTIRNNELPFGGLQVVLVGDFFQLPPISTFGNVAEFAYRSRAWKSLEIVTCYLSEQHRQEDAELLSLLSAIRSNEVEEMHFAYLESRIMKGETPPENITRLFTKNVSVDALNDASLSRLTGMEHEYKMESKGKASMVESLKKGCLSPETLIVKKESIVMCTKNNPSAGFANGTLGKVVEFQNVTHFPVIETRDGRKIVIEPMEWIVEEDGKVRARISQIPLRLAWAITVHKSQGMSLDAAVMDLSDVFEYGQGYVALSRVRTLDGIFLHGVNQKSLQVHPDVAHVDQHFREMSEKARCAFEALEKVEIKKMHENFLKACGGILEGGAKISKKKNKETTQHKTLVLIKNGFKIENIVNERKITEGTVIEHIGELVRSGMMEKDEVKGLCQKDLLLCLPTIFKAFDKKGATALAPVFSYLKGAYTYEELKLARILYI